MSTHTRATATRRVSTRDISLRKGKTPLVCLTAYTSSIARLLDDACDILLVGDSLGMVIYGYDSTLPVTMDMMLAHAQAVMRASHQACVVVDMPFASYQQSPQQAYANAALLMQQSGCQAIKLEGGLEMVETVAFLSTRGIPVMAHIGLKPQHVHSMGGYRYQGRTDTEAMQIMTEAKAFEKAGAFALLLEGVQENVAADVTKNVTIPTIGIGASVSCDGQVLVTEDMLGITAHVPSFVQSFASIGDTIRDAVSAYRDAVQSRTFPKPEHCYGTKKS